MFPCNIRSHFIACPSRRMTTNDEVEPWHLGGTIRAKRDAYLRLAPPSQSPTRSYSRVIRWTRKRARARFPRLPNYNPSGLSSIPLITYDRKVFRLPRECALPRRVWATKSPEMAVDAARRGT